MILSFWQWFTIWDDFQEPGLSGTKFCYTRFCCHCSPNVATRSIYSLCRAYLLSHLKWMHRDIWTHLDTYTSNCRHRDLTYNFCTYQEGKRPCSLRPSSKAMRTAFGNSCWWVLTCPKSAKSVDTRALARLKLHNSNLELVDTDFLLNLKTS